MVIVEMVIVAIWIVEMVIVEMVIVAIWIVEMVIVEMVIVAIRGESLAGFQRGGCFEQRRGDSAGVFGCHRVEVGTVEFDAPFAKCAGLGLHDVQLDGGADAAAWPVTGRVPAAHREVARVHA